MTFTPLTPALVRELEALVGSENIRTDPEKMEAYSHDETPADRYAHMPEAVVTPLNAGHVSAVMKLASREHIPVTPRGAGSGLSGGAIPVFGGIVLSFEKMNRILEIDWDNMVAVLEPGVVTNAVNEQASKRGLFFAGYPMSLETCFIGGNIAENAGGGRAVKYGVTGRYVLGIEVVMPSGEILSFGGKRVKDVTGYDLKQLFIGSEGTLGIITKAIIRLLPRPAASCVLLVPFRTVEEAIAAVPAVMTESRILLTSVEFMDALSFGCSCRYLNERLSFEGAGAMLLIETDGSDADQAALDAERAGELCMKHGALEVYVADNHTTRERVWSIRRNIAEAFKVESPHQSLEDIVVPIARIPDIMKEAARISSRYGIAMPTYGHAGDGNLHVTLVKPPELSMNDWYEIERRSLDDLYEAVAALGGTLSGEHGIGSKRKACMKRFVGDGEYELMKKIKDLIDPAGILNPGKMFS